MFRRLFSGLCAWYLLLYPMSCRLFSGLCAWYLLRLQSVPAVLLLVLTPGPLQLCRWEMGFVGWDDLITVCLALKKVTSLIFLNKFLIKKNTLGHAKYRVCNFWMLKVKNCLLELLFLAINKNLFTFPTQQRWLRMSRKWGFFSLHGWYSVTRLLASSVVIPYSSPWFPDTILLKYLQFSHKQQSSHLREKIVALEH